MLGNHVYFVRGAAIVAAVIALAAPAAAAVELMAPSLELPTVTRHSARREQSAAPGSDSTASTRPSAHNRTANVRASRWPTLVHGRSARADCPKVDRYGRAVCRVIVDGVDVGLEQIRRGFAWHYVKYAHEQRAEDRDQLCARRTRRACNSRRALVVQHSDPALGLPPNAEELVGSPRAVS